MNAFELTRLIERTKTMWAHHYLPGLSLQAEEFREAHAKDPSMYAKLALLDSILSRLAIIADANDANAVNRLMLTLDLLDAFIVSAGRASPATAPSVAG